MTAVAQLGAPRRALPQVRDSVGRGVSRILGVLIVVLFGLGAAATAAPVVLFVLGFQPNVVDTKSMQPTIAAGDLVISEEVHPSSLRPGDVVTLADPRRPGIDSTTRVVAVAPFGDRYTIATQLPTTSTVTPWVVPEGAGIARIAYRLPAIDRAVDVTSSAIAPKTLPLVVATLVAVALAVRRWMAPVPARGRRSRPVRFSLR